MQVSIAPSHLEEVSARHAAGQTVNLPAMAEALRDRLASRFGGLKEGVSVEVKPDGFRAGQVAPWTRAADGVWLYDDDGDGAEAADAMAEALCGDDLWEGEWDRAQVIVEAVNPYSGARVELDVADWTQGKLDGFAAVMSDESWEAADGDSPAEWLKSWAEIVGPEEAGRVLLGS